MKVFINDLINVNEIVGIQVDLYPINLTKPFNPPQEDFFIILNSDGIKYLKEELSCSRSFSYGIFTTIEKNENKIFSCNFLNQKIAFGIENLFHDEYFLDGLVFFTNFNKKNNEKFNSVFDFLKKYSFLLSMVGIHRNNRPALFLDRDGIINIDSGYPSKVDKIKLFDDIFPIIKLANDHSMPVIVLTNQSGVAKGKLTEQDLNNIHNYIAKICLENNCKIDAFYFCPYHIEGNQKEYLKKSMYRKPYPLMALKASEDFNLDLNKSVMVGDKFTDYLLGPRMKTIVLESKYTVNELTENENIFMAKNHLEILSHLTNLFLNK